ncbi:ATP-dependent 6-phosphofructokinase 5, chloroplastic-like [Humulus lupulus]|uniref:ATP-dependent 6-phosphofructokinase 5, chloroplastic-like n=2 Tax=Humulus lupulus TaxID=3486 RepID=UPI002B403014|nr:ATP-dependent 6-phosphofructokinase 5, chloroplastic-like [Humulus lupulus]
MYPIERSMGVYKQYVRNRARPEGSIAEAYVVNEALTFCSMYLRGVETRFNRPERNDDRVESQPNREYSIYKAVGRPFGKKSNMLLNPQLKQKAEWYILNNCAEIKEYLSEHMDELRRRGGLNLEVQQKTDFPQWFKERVNGLHESTPTEVNNELYALANKSSGTVYSYPGMIVNGVKFVTRGRDMKLKTQNCGVMVPSEEGVNYYGICYLSLTDMVFVYNLQFFLLCFLLLDCDYQLTRKVVQNVHLSSGSLLGVSRGGPGISEIVDSMEERGINMLFVLGGNGTHAGANVIHKECCRRGVKVAVVGVPKTIDNDILLMDKTFGFDTAVEEAQRAINSAYIEAHSAYHGIGIVKLMGRSSGFIALHASLASGQFDICLIPEVPFHLHGPYGVLRHLKYLIETKGSAVVCVAEGAGQVSHSITSVFH